MVGFSCLFGVLTVVASFPPQVVLDLVEQTVELNEYLVYIDVGDAENKNLLSFDFYYLFVQAD